MVHAATDSALSVQELAQRAAGLSAAEEGGRLRRCSAPQPGAVAQQQRFQLRREFGPEAVGGVGVAPAFRQQAFHRSCAAFFILE
jgi:hypothetical protein